MTIDYTCPKCRQKLSAGDDKAGVTFPCSKCGQRVKVPALSTGATVLGEPLKGRVTTLLDGVLANPASIPREIFGQVLGQKPVLPLSTAAVTVRDLLATNWIAFQGDEFERFLVEVFSALGYQAEKIGKTGDDGCDLKVYIGTKRIAVQAKGYPSGNTVGGKAVNEAHTAKTVYECNYCLVITNSKFTKPARRRAKKVKCGLIDRFTLPYLIRGLFIPHACVLLSTPPAPTPAPVINWTFANLTTAARQLTF